MRSDWLRLGAAAVASCLLLAGAASAQGVAATGRIPTVTRLVKIFHELEGALDAATRGGDATAAGRMLAEDFELRVASAPGNPTPRDEWLRLSVANPGPEMRAEQMAVHDFGTVAVVSFVQVAASGDARKPSRDIATVDVWKRDGERWLLAVRYAGPSAVPGFVVPGESTEPPIPKRY
jgi:ketosteroid isomerase-like protein